MVPQKKPKKATNKLTNNNLKNLTEDSFGILLLFAEYVKRLDYFTLRVLLFCLTSLKLQRFIYT